MHSSGSPMRARVRRRLAVGEFDGVHVGHREVIRGADTVLTFEPHPRTVVAPAAAPKLLTTLDQKADLVALARRRGAGRDPVRRRPFAAQTAQEFIDHVLVGAARRHLGVGGRELPLRQQAPAGTRTLLRAQDAFETRVVEMVELEGEIVSSTHIRGLVAAGDVPAPTRLLGAPFHMRGTSSTATSAAARSGSRRPTSCPTRALVVPDHGIYACRAEVPDGGADGAASSRRAADVQDRPRPARRGVPARLRRRHLRPRAAAGLPRAPARRAPLRRRRGADRADARRRPPHRR